MLCNATVSSRGREFLCRFSVRTKIQLLVLSSHLSWHYRPPFPRRSCYILFHFNSCTQKKQRSFGIKSTVYAFTFSMGFSRNWMGNILSYNSKRMAWWYLKSGNRVLQRLVVTWKINCLNIIWSIFLITFLMNILFSVVLDLICLEDNCHYIKEQTVH